MTRTTSPGTPAGHDRVVASIDDGEPSVLLEGSEVDVEYYDPSRDRRSSRGVDAERMVLLARTLATGDEQAWSVDYRGRRYDFRYSFDAPEEYREDVAPAAQTLWFYPMDEGWYAFQMQAGPLILALAHELAWLAVRIDGKHLARASIETALVLLDQAMLRCSL